MSPIVEPKKPTAPTINHAAEPVRVLLETGHGVPRVDEGPQGCPGNRVRFDEEADDRARRHRKAGRADRDQNIGAVTGRRCLDDQRGSKVALHILPAATYPGWPNPRTGIRRCSPPERHPARCRHRCRHSPCPAGTPGSVGCRRSRSLRSPTASPRRRLPRVAELGAELTSHWLATVVVAPCRSRSFAFAPTLTLPCCCRCRHSRPRSDGATGRRGRRTRSRRRSTLTGSSSRSCTARRVRSPQSWRPIAMSMEPTRRQRNGGPREA